MLFGSKRTLVAAVVVAGLLLWIVISVGPGSDPAPAERSDAAARSDAPAAAPSLEAPGDPGGAGAAAPPAERRAVEPAVPASEPVRGVVIDAATRVGVPGARVGGRLALNVAQLRALRGEPAPDSVALTDADGRFALRELGEGVERLVAVHFDYAPGAADLPAPAGEVVIALSRGPHVFGSVRDDAGAPAPDVHVRVFGPDWPRGVSAMTDDAGEYRTGAVHPGPVEVIATPTFGRTTEDTSFTPEWKQARIESVDLRVDFGPSPEQITWRGRVIDEQGEPIEYGRLELEPVDAPVGGSGVKRGRLERGFDEGSFEFRKLRPTLAYQVRGRLGDDPASIDLGRVVFDLPGVVEHDLHLAFTSIHGVVVDAATGAPPPEGGNVYVQPQGRAGTGTHHSYDGTGLFCARGRAPGIYGVYAGAQGYSGGNVQGVRVDGVTALEPLRIEVQRGGALSVELSGFEPNTVFEVEFRADGGARYTPARATDEAGAFEATWTLAPATWVVAIRVPGIGGAEQEVPLAAGGEGRALFLPGDLTRFEGRVAVEGTLRTAAGEPVEGAFLSFYCGSAELSEDERLVQTPRTDAEGRFRAPGFAAGRWSVHATLAAGGQVDFDDLLIPTRPLDPTPLHLVLPSGSLRARLVDAAAGAPFGGESPLWWAFLREVSSEKLVAELQGGHRGPRLEMNGIPAGRFELLVRARGYFERTIDPFDVAEGEAFDLGELALEPCAVLEVEVRDTIGGPLEGFRVLVDGGELHGFRAFDRAPGVASWDGLGAGTVTVSVELAGHETVARSVQLVEGEVTTESFMLVSD